MSSDAILDKHLDAVTDNSKTVRNIYLSYLVFATYIWLTVESVTHLQLLIPKEGLSLPIIGVKLGVVGFFVVAPILLVLFHTYFSLHVWKLAELLHKVRLEMQGKVKDWQDQIPGSMFLWMFLENHRRGGLVSMLMNAFVFLSFWCVVPVVILRCQWQFLPYHHATINALLQVLLILSLALSGFFYVKIAKIKLPKMLLHCFKEDGRFNNYWLAFKTDCLIFTNRVFKITSIIFTFLFIYLMPVFSTTVLIIPETIEENEACFEKIQKPIEWIAYFLRKELRPKKTEDNMCIQINKVVARNLDLREKDLALKPGETLIAAFKDNEEDLFKHYKTLDLQGRHLEFADFSKADLRKVDLRKAHFKGAGLFEAQLQGANLSYAQLQGADLGNARLQGADLGNARLQGADLFEAQLQGADLGNARLQGAGLWHARLQGANLGNAQLQGANLGNAQLQGAGLFEAQLQGANLSYAQLQGADLFEAQLQGADLGNARLQGADLSYAQLQGADLEGAQLQGAGLWNAQLQGAGLWNAQLQGAGLWNAQLQGANLGNAQLQGADLVNAQLQGAGLWNAQLQGADLFEAQLQGADLGNARLQGADFSQARLGSLNLTAKELTTLINAVSEQRDARKTFEERMRISLGKRTTIEVSKGVEIRHSFPTFEMGTEFEFSEKPGLFPRTPWIFNRLIEDQIQFKNISSLPEKESIALREEIYRSLLCEHPILIERNLKNEERNILNQFSSPLNPEEVIDYASEHCPQHLPEKYRSSMTVSSQKN